MFARALANGDSAKVFQANRTGSLRDIFARKKGIDLWNINFKMCRLRGCLAEHGCGELCPSNFSEVMDVSFPIAVDAATETHDEEEQG